MKKLYKFVAIILVCFAFCICFLTACDDAVNKVAYSCAADGEYMVLPVKFKKAWQESSCTAFITNRSLEDMKAAVENKKEKGAEYSAEVFGNFLFIEKKTGSTVHYFTVAKRAEDTYYFTSSVNHFDVGTDVFGAFVPFHLLQLNSDNLKYGVYTVEEGTEYKINSTVKDIAEFYKRVDIYDVEEAENLITVSLTKSSESYLSFGTFEITFAIRGAETYAVYKIID